MAKFGIKFSKDKNIKVTPIKNLGGTSEANQWKKHLVGRVDFTADPQLKTFKHGLNYTPAFLIFKKAISGSALVFGPELNAVDYADNENIVLSSNGFSTGTAVFILFKDFGR